MRPLKILFALLALSGCNNQIYEETDLSDYFHDIDGTAVFYNPALRKYKIYNQELSTKRSSPCSTFKIMSAYIALSEKIITPQNSTVSWNKKNYEYSAWNKNMDLHEAFRTSCVWYFRAVIDKISPAVIKKYLQHYHYGNQDVSDWAGALNTNTETAELKGFWIESSLKISPIEQVDFLRSLFQENNHITQHLKEIMKISDNPVKIYGKTGLGIKNDLVENAWFIGFYEKDGQHVYFAVRLNDKSNRIKDYRHQASQYAKEIALDIIENADLF